MRKKIKAADAGLETKKMLKVSFSLETLRVEATKTNGKGNLLLVCLFFFRKIEENKNGKRNERKRNVAGIRLKKIKVKVAKIE